MALKFPADFDKCVREGGRVRTINPKEGTYIHVCYDKQGKAHSGEVKHSKKETSEESLFLINQGYIEKDDLFIKSSETKLKSLAPQIELTDKIFSSRKPTSEIEILHAGEWEHPQYGIIKITEEDIDKFVDSFNSKVRKVDIAVDQEHMPEKGAAGWYRSLKKVFEDGKAKLKAKIEWTKLGTQLVSDGIFKYFSPEFDFQYEDLETHEVYDNVLLGGALTNRPYFKSLAPVALSENMFAGFQMAEYQCECLECGYKMKTTEHCADVKCPKCGGKMRRAERPGVGEMSEKKGGENRMTKDELKAKLAEDAEFALPEDASEEDKKSYEEVKAELAKDAEDKEEGDEEEKEEEEKEEEEKEKKEEPVQGSEKYISKADHVKQMNEMKSKLGIVEKKLRFKEVQAEVRGYVFSESNPDGVLLPKNEKTAVDLLMAATPNAAKLFSEFLKGLPKVSAKLFKEEGGDSEADAQSAIDSEVEKVLKANEGMKYSEALKVVSREKPELFKK
jgi:phage I-like protein/DNA-directed RNA polymerase subunit RPC12/RpoP